MKIILFIILVLFLNSCTNNKDLKVIKNQKPSWLNNPTKEANGKVTAVGCAFKHYKGIAAQKKLAISRAVDEIALQVNVEVTSNTYRTKSSHSSSKISIESLQKVQNTNISTTLMDTYTNNEGEICVWLIKNN